MDRKQDKALGCMMGLAVGDAVGTTLEFKRRDSYQHLTDMIGGGPFGLAPGEWTDDTSMALALGDSLIQCQGFQPDDVMNRFLAWWQKGEYSHNGRCFDIGVTTLSALRDWRASDRRNPYLGPTDDQSSGNGCIMRLAPVPIAFHNDLDECKYISGQQSALTHGSSKCLYYSKMFGEILWREINDQADNSFARWLTKSRSEIQSTGYVVHTFEAALWCIATTSTFRDAVLTAANLGNDADTVGAVTGQIAGARYGVSGIPEHWIRQLAWGEFIQDMGAALFTMG